MEQFSLGKYLANPERNIVTREGKKVRIICTDRAGSTTKPVVALITLPNGDENIKSYWANGIETAGSDGKDDLFFAPSKHTDYINLYHKKDYSLGSIVFSSEEKAKEVANDLEGYLTTIKIEWED